MITEWCLHRYMELMTSLEVTKDIADYNANQYLTKEELREKSESLGNRMAALL